MGNRDITPKEIMKKDKGEIELIKKKFLMSNLHTIDFQQDHLVELKILINHFMDKFAETKKVPSEMIQLSKNLIVLTDKMRKQDEGIKINADISTTHNEFREIIELEAKKQTEKEKFNEWKERKERDNGTRPDSPKK